MITKANRRSTVHRPCTCDTISVKKFDRAGNAVGEQLFVGLLTSGAYSQNSREIPLLRQKVANCSGARRLSRPPATTARPCAHILETYPRDELFQISENELYDTRPRHPASAGAPAHRPLHPPRSVRALRLLPRLPAARPLQHASSGCASRTSWPAPTNGTVSAYYTHMSDAALGRLQVIIATTRGAIPDVDTQ